MRKSTQQQKQKANNRHSKRLAAKLRPRSQQTPTVPAKFAGALAVQGQNLREILFALLDSAGGSIEVTFDSIVRVRSQPLVIRSRPNDDGGYLLELVDKAELETVEPLPETATEACT